MGYQYVQCIIAGNVSHLSPTALRMFLRMALVVRDSDDPTTGELEGMYYGGWKGLTACLGYGIYERNEPLPANVEKKIERGMRELRDAGYLGTVPDSTQREHATRVYRLNIARIPIV